VPGAKTSAQSRLSDPVPCPNASPPASESSLGLSQWRAKHRIVTGDRQTDCLNLKPDPLFRQSLDPSHHRRRRSRILSSSRYVCFMACKSRGGRARRRGKAHKRKGSRVTHVASPSRRYLARSGSRSLTHSFIRIHKNETCPLLSSARGSIRLYQCSCQDGGT